jgi:hypothetical protein
MGTSIRDYRSSAFDLEVLPSVTTEEETGYGFREGG